MNSPENSQAASSTAAKSAVLDNPVQENWIEGLVVQVLDYKEADGIVRLAADDGLVSFYARGIQRQGSKNRRLCIPGTVVRLQFDPRYSSDLLFLLHGDVLKMYDQSAFSLEGQAAAAAMEFMTAEYGSSRKRRLLLETAWDALQQNHESEGIAALCLLMWDILKSEGIAMETGECVRCGHTDGICGIDREEGGFVCRRHPEAFEEKGNREAEAVRHSKDWLKKMRLLSRADLRHLPLLLENASFSWSDLLDLFDWYNWQLHTNPAPFRFFASLVRNRPAKS